MPGVHRDRLSRAAAEKRQSRLRLICQTAAAVLFNGYIAGFAKGRIYSGRSKLLCVPVLNCYSCPGALGSCPIGALQTVAGGARHNISFYALGTLMLFGILFARLICGFLCPFGWIQDLLARISLKKLTVKPAIDRPLRRLKYAVLLLLVLLLPTLATDRFGLAPPFFCQYLCPAGTLEGGLPHLLLNPELRSAIGPLFAWKFFLLLLILAGAIFIPRCFCRYLCPLGAFYSLFNRCSLYRLELNKELCTGCNKCETVCPMAVKVTQNINSGECIRCGRCKAACPAGAISSGFAGFRHGSLSGECGNQ